MTVIRLCPECGADLPSDSPEGLCPRCLLQHGLGTSTPAPGSVAETGPFGAAFTAPSPADLAPHFPQLEIEALLGQGGMGAVYKARQVKLDRPVALKILPPEWGRDPAFAERFAREAKALARMSHPHIVAVHDFGEAGGFYYFIMEFVDGVNLRQMMQSRKLLPQDALLTIPQICDALEYAHGEGIVHRDIKPENILLDRKGRVKIADFGLAKLINRPRATFTLTASHQIMGTLDYMAPEQREQPLAVDHRADIYSLGVVFYEMLTGKLPLGRFAAPSEKAKVDRRIDDVIFRALEREPENRYQRVSEIKTAMEALREKKVRPAAPREVVSEVPDLDQEIAELDVKGPAAALLLTGIAAFCYVTAIVIALIVNARPHRGPFYGSPDLDWTLFTLGAGVVYGLVALIFVGAISLARLNGYQRVLMAIVLAMLPLGPHILIGIPAGIWAYNTLQRRGVKQRFIQSLCRSRKGRLDEEQAAVELEVKGLVVLLTVTGILAFCFVTFIAGALLTNNVRPGRASGPFDGPPGLDWPLFIAGALLVYALVGLIFVGAVSLSRLRRYDLIMLAAILVMLPLGPHIFLGLPTGVMVISVLKKPHVKAVFVRNLRRGETPIPVLEEYSPDPTGPQPTGPVQRKARSFWHSFRTMFFSSPDRDDS